jgi:heme/copper-type cytochrome/quinol oxidase subunit 2
MVKMEKTEKRYLYLLIAIAVLINAVTISPLVPSQRWTFWSQPSPTKIFHLAISDYQFTLPATGMTVKVGEPVKFVVTSTDVTYGFGVFYKRGKMLFQIQVLPCHTNEIIWIFEEPGVYTIRSTEYSGPQHSSMVVPDAISVVP